MDAIVSTRIRFFSFASMVLLVFIHSYNFVDYEISSRTFINAPLDINNFIQYFLVNGLFRFRIPLLMLISGYLLAHKSDMPYVELGMKRVHSLLIPYILVSTITLVAVCIIELIFYHDRSTGFWGQTKVIDYSFKQLITNWLIWPIPFQLWYLKMLFFFTISFPAVLYFLKKNAILFLSTLFIFRLCYEDKHHSLIFFFSLGVYLQQIKYNIKTTTKHLPVKRLFLITVILITLKTFIAFKHPIFLGDYGSSILSFLTTLHICLTTIVYWFGMDKLVLYCMKIPAFVRLTSTSFFIYAFHEPLTSKLIKPALHFFSPYYGGKLLAFVILPICITILCIIADGYTARYMPRFYNLITGNRGRNKKISITA